MPLIRRLRSILETQGLAAVDTLKGIFTGGNPIYPGSGFDEKTHVKARSRSRK
ncbi:conserved hypothetical protein [Candidatus Sulfopaludibacter sp. SbA4]|nr:conserved hypothetical protein [Candidatus Sulfopaludibacter sp. SbA4]